MMEIPKVKGSSSNFSLSSSVGAVRMHDLKESSDEDSKSSTNNTSQDSKSNVSLKVIERRLDLRRTSSDLSRSSLKSSLSENRFSSELPTKINAKLHSFASDTKAFIRQRTTHNKKNPTSTVLVHDEDDDHLIDDDEEEDHFQPASSLAEYQQQQQRQSVDLSSSRGSSPSLHIVDDSSVALDDHSIITNKNNSNNKVDQKENNQEKQAKKTSIFDGKTFSFMSSYWRSLLALVAVFPLFTPLPLLVCGLLLGFYLGVVVVDFVYSTFFIPTSHKNKTKAASDRWNEFEQSSEIGDIDSTDQRLLHVEKVVYKGWLNILRSSYDPNKHRLNTTNSVLVRLDADVLRVSVPKTNVSKHGFWNETKNEKPTFVSQEIYNMSGASVTLRPVNLARRRWWSRKYPICIEFDIAHTGGAGVVETRSVGAEISTEEEGEESDQDSVDESAPIRPPRRPRSVASVMGVVPVKNELKENKKLRKKTKEKSGRKILFFARSSREKEQWFHQLRKAAGQHSLRSRVMTERGAHSESESSEQTFDQLCLDWILYSSLNNQFKKSMDDVLSDNVVDAQVALEAKEEKKTFQMDLRMQMWKPTCRVSSEMAANKENIIWANALVSRIFFDFSKDPDWISRVKARIEKKMETIRLPYFIETLKLNKLEMGTTPPRITGVYEPTVDEWGLWVDVNMEYKGGIRLVLETKLNLMKLKTEGRHAPSQNGESASRFSDEELPESPESSGEDEPILPFFNKKTETQRKHDAESPKESTGKKLLNFVDKITQSKYFQEATENKYVKKLMQGVSDTPLILMVEVIYVEGTLALNIPAPPSDRLWYSFRCPPKVILKARPKVGERSLNVTHVTDWIENKLGFLLEKFLVLPNMDDLIVPLMSGSPLFKNINQ